MTRRILSTLLLSAAILSVPAIPGQARHKAKTETSPQFDRNQIMLINLDRGQSSTSAYLKDSLDATRGTMKELDKGLHQLEQVDKSYAKSRGRPDDNYLAGPEDEIKAARKSAEQLEAQLKAPTRTSRTQFRKPLSVRMQADPKTSKLLLAVSNKLISDLSAWLRQTLFNN